MCRLSTTSSTTMSSETTGVHATTDRGVMRRYGGLQCGSQLYRCTDDVATVQMKWLFVFWNGTALDPPTSQMVPLIEGFLLGMTLVFGMAASAALCSQTLQHSASHVTRSLHSPSLVYFLVSIPPIHPLTHSPTHAFIQLVPHLYIHPRPCSPSHA